MEQRFLRAIELFTDLSNHCSETGIYMVIDETGALRLYDSDSVFNVAEQEFSDHDDPILSLVETLDGVAALEKNLGHVNAGYVDMVF